MKIGILIGSLTGGGAEKVALNLYEEICKNYKDSIECDLIVLNKTGDYVVNDSVIFLNSKYSEKNIIKKIFYHYFFYSYKLKRLKQKRKYEKFISFTTLPNIINIKTKKTEKCVISVRNYSSLNLDVKKQRIVRKMYHKADDIVAVSELCKMDLIENFGLDEKQIRVIYNPYNIEKIHSEMCIPIQSKHKKIYDSSFVIIAVGRISDQKAFWRIIKAVSVIKESISDVKLIIIGKELNGTENTEILLELIDRYKLNENIEMIGFQQNPYNYMFNSDLYILSSQFEGFPNAMTEAMVCGLPIISVNCLSGPKEILSPNSNDKDVNSKISDGEFGCLIPQYSDTKLGELTTGDYNIAKKAIDLFNNNEKLEEYKRRSIERSSEFNVCRIVKKWVE